MSILVKGSLMESVPEGQNFVRIRAGVRQSSRRPLRGDEVFVWTSESNGGDGLFAMGIVRACECESHQKERAANPTQQYVVNVEISGRPVQSMRKVDIAPHRNDNDGTPIFELGHKLYGQSHEKVIALSDDCGRYVRSHFIQILEA